MTYTINSYFAVLIITIFGAGAALLIIHVANSDTLQATVLGNESTLSFQK